MASLSRQERALVDEVYGEPRRKKVWSHDHHIALERYGEALRVQMQDVSDEELNRLIAEVESRTVGPIRLEGTS
jgi:hypothetical protein